MAACGMALSFGSTWAIEAMIAYTCVNMRTVRRSTWRWSNCSAVNCFLQQMPRDDILAVDKAGVMHCAKCIVKEKPHRVKKKILKR